MLQALLVVPAFALVYLVAAPTPLRRRIGQLLAGRSAPWSSSAGWWVAIVELVPAVDAALHRRLAEQQHPRADLRLQRLRPAHRRRDRQRRRRRGWAAGGGVGRDRLDRGCSTPRSAARSPGCCRPRCSCWWPGSGLTRAARRGPTAPAPRCSSGAAGCSSPALVFSFMQGIFHAYYTVALAPGDRRARRHRRGACCGAAAATGGRRGRSPPTVAVTAAWAFVLLPAAATSLPWLRSLVLVGRPGRAPLAAASCVAGCRRRVAAAVAARGRAALRWPAPRRTRCRPRRPPHTGSIPTAGPGGGRRRPRRAAAVARAAFGAGGAGRRPVQADRQAPRPGMPQGGTGRRHDGGRPAPAAAWAGCSTAARSSAALHALLSGDAVVVHLGRGGGRLQQRRRLPAGHRRRR